MSADETTAPAVRSTDEQRLHELGYAQELLRQMSGFSNFAVSFTIISILSGCLTLYGYGMITGPPEFRPVPYRVRQPDRIEMIVKETAKLVKPDICRRSSWAYPSS